MTRNGMMLAALCGLLVTAGCHSPLMYRNDIEWPSTTECKKMGIEKIVCATTKEETVFFAPTHEQSSRRFIHGATLLGSSKFKKGKDSWPIIPWGENTSGIALMSKLDDWPGAMVEIITGPPDAVRRIRERGSMSIDQFGRTVLIQDHPSGEWRAVVNEAKNVRSYDFTVRFRH